MEQSPYSSPITGGEEHPAPAIRSIRIRCQAAAGHPNSPAGTFRRNGEDASLLQSSGVVTHDPAMPRALVAERRPSDVNHAVQEKQAWRS